MSPTCFAKSATNAFSVAVLVSAGELAKSASIRFATSSDSAGFATLTMYQPTWSRPKSWLIVSFR